MIWRKRTGPKRIITEAAQNFTFTRRAMVLGGAQAGLGVLLAGRMAYLSILENVVEGPPEIIKT